MTDLLFVVVTLVVTLVAIAGVIATGISFITGAVDRTTLLFKVGMLLGALGLIGQISRNMIFFIDGTSPMDGDFPIWTLKDFGLSLMLFESARKWRAMKQFFGHRSNQ